MTELHQNSNRYCSKQTKRDICERCHYWWLELHGRGRLDSFQAHSSKCFQMQQAGNAA